MTMWKDTRVRIGTDVNNWTVDAVTDGRPFKDDFPDRDVRVVPVTDTLFINVRLNHANGPHEGGDYRLTVSYRGHLNGTKGFCFAEKSAPYLLKHRKPGVGKTIASEALDMAKRLLPEALRRQAAGAWLRTQGAASIERQPDGASVVVPPAAEGIVNANVSKAVTEELTGL
jgi:hypothetical protein